LDVVICIDVCPSNSLDAPETGLDVSNGCVNMPLEFAGVSEENIPLFDSILVVKLVAGLLKIEAGSCFMGG